MGDSISSSSKSVSRSSSASHLRLVAFWVHLAGGEAIYAGEGGHAMGEAVQAQVAAAWGQQLRRWVPSAASLEGW
jgi:hypothetical protein